MTTINSNKNDYIILSGSNIGTKIYMRTPIITYAISNNIDTNNNIDTDLIKKLLIIKTIS